MSQNPSSPDTTENREAPSSSGSTESSIQQKSNIIPVHGAMETKDAETIEGAKGSSPSLKSVSSNSDSGFKIKDKSKDMSVTRQAVDISKSEEKVQVLSPKKTNSQMSVPVSQKIPTETQNITTEVSKVDDDKLATNIISISGGPTSPKAGSVNNKYLIKLLNKTPNLAYPSGIKISTPPKSKELASPAEGQVKNALMIKLSKKGFDSGKDADISKRLVDANILKNKPLTPQSSKKNASTAEMLKLSLKNMESNSLMSDQTNSPRTHTHESKSFELERLDSPKDTTKSIEARKLESPSDSKKVESPKKKKTGSPKTRSNAETPTRMDSPKVIVTNPSGTIVDVIEPEADVTKSPKKKPLVKSDKHKALFPKDDSGLSGSGSDCESSEQRVFTSPFAWCAPVTNNKAVDDDDDLLHITALIYGTWSKVYRWPPASERLPRPREVTFERPSKLESVLYTCRCKNDYMDFYAPIKMLPEDDHDRVFSCQLVNQERDVMEALEDDRCVCRVVPLVNKIVFLPINEHYVLMYRLESDITYNEMHPNTVFLLYKGVPSKQELEHHIGQLQISKRPGSITFMDKYDE